MDMNQETLASRLKPSKSTARLPPPPGARSGGPGTSGGLLASRSTPALRLAHPLTSKPRGEERARVAGSLRMSGSTLVLPPKVSWRS